MNAEGLASPPQEYAAGDAQPMLRWLACSEHGAASTADARTVRGQRVAASFFAQFSQPMLLLDEFRAICDANDAARHLLDTSEVLQERDGILVCRSAEGNRALAESLRQLQLACESDAVAGRGCVRTIRVRRSDGWHVHFFLSRVPASGDAGAGARALLVIYDPRSAGVSPDPVLVSETFSLTPAEARVAVKLAHGWTVKEIALEHSTSVATVRCQVQQALQKTGVSRQADLVRLLLALPFWQRR